MYKYGRGIWQECAGRFGGEVLPLQQRIREQPRHHFDVGFDEGIVALATNTRMPVPDVHRIAEQAFPIGADVQHHRNHAVRVNTPGCGVYGQLADRNFNTAYSPVTDSENLLGISGENQIDSVRAGAEVDERLFNGFRIIDRKIDTTRSPALVVVLLHCEAHCQVVDDGDHLPQMLGKEAKEKNVITVVQRREINVPAQCIGQPLVLNVGSPHLGFE